MFLKLMERILTITVIVLFIIAIGNKIFEGVKANIEKELIEKASIHRVYEDTHEIIIDFDNQLHLYNY